MKEIIENPPVVSRMTDGLRDTGYELNTAIADIVDNSISANATLVDIRIARDFNGQILISIADNGDGMNKNELVNAMTYGSRKRSDPSSLGKFGLGLKTASTAFCKRLIVISKNSESDFPLKAIWDLDVIGDADKWNLEIDDQLEDFELNLFNESVGTPSGTLVIWDKIDRLQFNYKKSDGRAFANALRRLEESLRDHIAMVFQRFIDVSDIRESTLQIKINGKEVEAWDPFCINETKSPVLEQNVPVELPNGSNTSFTIKAYILPRKEEFSSEIEKLKAKISNERQGVYVYRENRLIHGPDWLNMYKSEPHFSLLRVELSFDHNLDSAFQVDIKKSKISLNESLYEYIRDKFLSGPRREAEIRYRKGQAAIQKGAAALIHASSNNAIGQKEDSLKTAKISGIDTNSDQAIVTNNEGTTKRHIKILANTSSQPAFITTQTSLDNGVLWEASLSNGKLGVMLNSGHPYYLKSYLPNKSNSTIIQALDFLLWALAQAELNNTNEENKEAFEEFRIEVSRNLKKLVSDLPEPTELDEEQ